MEQIEDHIQVKDGTVVIDGIIATEDSEPIDLDVMTWLEQPLSCEERAARYDKWLRNLPYD